CLSIVSMRASCCSFFLSAPATTALYTLSLHDALPICVAGLQVGAGAVVVDRRLQHRILQGAVAGRAAILPRAAGVAASPPSGYNVGTGSAVRFPLLFPGRAAGTRSSRPIPRVPPASPTGANWSSGRTDRRLAPRRATLARPMRRDTP